MSADLILNTISLAANTSLVLNLIIHMLILASILALFLVSNLKIQRYLYDGVLFILAASVAVISIIIGNPFNLIAFGILAIISVVELIQGKNEVARPKLNFNTIVSLIFIFIGFWYPEFVKTDILSMLAISPVGTIPCPTLLVLLGMINLIVPQVNKVQFISTLVLGIFYGLTGVFQLKVYLDIALILIVLYSFYNFRFIFRRKKS
jgi:hypothetical protein